MTDNELALKEYQGSTQFLIGVSFSIIFGLVIYRICKKGRIQYSKSRSGKSYFANSVLKLFQVDHPDKILDKFCNLDSVTESIRKAGLESCNLIFGIDFTASNYTQGKHTFRGLPLHQISHNSLNPYQTVIKTIGKTLSSFDEDGLIPSFGFGDISTKDKAVFSLKLNEYCVGFEEVLTAYNSIAPSIKMSGPTSFAPIIYQAIEIVKDSREYHILIIVADGQVTSEKSTVHAIVEASKWPLSIIVIGVGDGPWDTMHEFDDKIPQRKFDNFQFVDYNHILTLGQNDPQSIFALYALMEIPDQYKTIRSLGLLDF